MKRLFAVVALACSICHADELGIHIASHHWPQRENNNVNPGLYVRGDDGKTAGFYFNSERRWSAYAGMTYHIGGPFDVTVGGITGYHRFPVLPLVAPSLTIGEHVRLAVLPKMGPMGATVVHLMWETKL